MTRLIAASTDPRGVSIAIAGLLIVFVALLLISLFIASLPRILEFVARYWPEVDDSHGRHGHAENSDSDDAAVFAAIGFVLHTELQRQIATDTASVKKG